jgi:thymidylate kinase
LAIYIDVPPEVVVKRIRRKKSVMERLETQRKVKEVYMKFVDNGKLMSIDGDRKKSEVEKNILKVTMDFLEKRKAS